VFPPSISTTLTEFQLSSASNQTPPARPAAAPTATVQPKTAAYAAPSTWAKHFQLTAVAAIVIGYAALSHYSSSAPDAKGLGAVLSVAPVALIGVILVWRWTRPLVALLTAILLCACLYRYWPVVMTNYEWADLAQQCGAYALVATSFARSLFGNRVPLCTQLSDKLHGPLTPVEIAYTRHATVAWAVFYTLLATAILILFFEVSLRTWSLFVNFAAFGLIIFMGLADHAIRHRVLPRHRDGGILAAIRRALIG
jgi:uncharacterized membrane protein